MPPDASHSVNAYKKIVLEWEPFRYDLYFLLFLELNLDTGVVMIVLAFMGFCFILGPG